MNSQSTAVISSISLLSSNAATVTLKASDIFSFIAGQYISITLPELEEKDIQEQFRDFSVASAPAALPFLEITFRLSDSLFKQTLLKRPVGSEVLLDGPAGVFVLPESTRPVRLVAGGVGITPFLSMARSSQRNLTIQYYNSSKDSALYLDELSRMPHVELLPYYQRPERQHFINISDETAWYVAGSPGMATSVRTILGSVGVKDGNIMTEEFSGYHEEYA